MTKTQAKINHMAEPSGAISPELKKIMEEESKMVRGRFKNYETPGAGLPFCAGKFPGQPIYKKNFLDNEIYEVPLWVARWLNGVDKTAKALDGRIGACSYPIHGFKWDPGKPAPTNEDGEGGVPVPIVGVAKRKQRFGFESLEFDSGAV